VLRPDQRDRTVTCEAILVGGGSGTGGPSRGWQYSGHYVTDARNSLLRSGRWDLDSSPLLRPLGTSLSPVLRSGERTETFAQQGAVCIGHFFPRAGKHSNRRDYFGTEKLGGCKLHELARGEDKFLYGVAVSVMAANVTRWRHSDCSS
jgi:hypothetical protein